MKALISILILSVLFAAGSACAQVQEPQFPCEDDPKFAAFDFWIGEWEVHTGDGKFAGTNSIESAQRGCVLIENWTSATGGKGMSINYLDHASGEWVQIWNDGRVRQYFEQSEDDGETWVSWFEGLYTRKSVD